MEKYGKSIIPIIESHYDSFTNVEKRIADFFINNKEKVFFSAKNVANLLYVSEASLSRFAKKCGFSGYREFFYNYQESFTKVNPKVDNYTKDVLNTYQELLNKTYSLFDEAQINRIVNIITKKKRVYVYGKGSSGLAAQEFKLRFMRVGIDVESITDTHIMKMNSVLLNSDYLVIGISISGKTKEVISSLKDAKSRGATTILITSIKNLEYYEYCDEILLVAIRNNLENGNVISPQFPVLVMVDFIYTNLLKSDKFIKEALHSYTLCILDEQKIF